MKVDPISEARRQWEAHWAEADLDAMTAMASVLRAGQILTARLDAALKPHGITFTRLELLGLLYYAQQGHLPLRALSDRLLVHPASVTETVDRLERDGFVRRVPNPADRRGVLAEITKKGRVLVERTLPVLAEMRFGLDPIKPPDAARLERILRPLRQAAGDFDGR